MQIGIYSDLHVEYYTGKQASHHAKMIYQNKYDVLILAGDIYDSPMKDGYLYGILKRCYTKHLIYVPGNHDPAIPEGITIGDKTMHVLHRSAVDIKTQKRTLTFAGCTGWPPAPGDDWKPVRFFDKTRDEMNDSHIADRTFLEEWSGKADVIVTHFMPHRNSIADKYKNYDNRLFHVRFDDLIDSGKGPKLWVHGHTHVSCDYEVGRTRVICNPLGAPNENLYWKEKCMVSI